MDKNVSIDDVLVGALEILREGLTHKNMLLRALTSLMIHNEVYEYSISLEALKELDSYGLQYEVNDEVLKISVQFPKEYHFNDDSTGTLH
jgi:hypothetical protein